MVHAPVQSPLARSSADPLYCVPETEAELGDLLGRHGAQGRLLAGGQTLIPLLHREPMAGGAIIDLRRVAELDSIKIDEGGVTIGAMTTLARARTELGAIFPVLPECLGKSANFAVRNRATFGGSVALCDPASEPLAFLAAFDADMVLLSPRGRRTIKVMEIASGLGADEAILSLRIPRPPAGESAGFAEILRRRSGGRALAIAFARCDGTLHALTVSGSGLLPTRIEIGEDEPMERQLDAIAATPSAGAWLLAAARRALADARVRAGRP